MFASTSSGGMCFVFPDTCKTPAPPSPSPVPIPYPNTAQCTDLIPTVLKVTIENKPVIVQGDKIPMSAGDEAGVAGGVVSSMIKGPAEFKMGSQKVKAGGKGIIRLMDPTGHNGSGNLNQPAGGMQIVPSQMKVMILS